MSNPNEKVRLDNALGVILLTIGCIIAAYLYSLIEKYILTAWFYIKKTTIVAASSIPEDVNNILFKWVFWDDNFSRKLKSLGDIFNDVSYKQFLNLEYINNYLEPYNVTRDSFINYVNEVVLIIHAPLIILIFLYLTFKIIKKERHIRIHTIHSLAVQESKIWPTIVPVIYHSKMFLNSKDPNEGWYAMAEKPHDFYFANSFIEEFVSNDQQNLDKYGEIFYKPRPEVIYEYYTKELGQPFKGFDGMPYYKKSMFALGCNMVLSQDKLVRKLIDNLALMHPSYPKSKFLEILKENLGGKTLGKAISNNISFFFASKKKKEGMKKVKILKNLTESYFEKLRMTKVVKEINIRKKEATATVNEITAATLKKCFNYEEETKKSIFSFKKKKNKDEKPFVMPPEVKVIYDNYNYENTFITALIIQGRLTTGVAASGEMVWLKEVDRRFFYIIAQTGRKSSFCTVAGTVSHYLFEKKCGFKIVTPHIYNAIKSVDKHMSRYYKNYIPMSRNE